MSNIPFLVAVSDGCKRLPLTCTAAFLGLFFPLSVQKVAARYLIGRRWLHEFPTQSGGELQVPLVHWKARKTSGCSSGSCTRLILRPRTENSQQPLHHTKMAMSCRYAAQRCASQLRSTSSVRLSAQMLRVSSTTRRYNSTDAAPTNPKIAEIVNQISQLTLLETADLVSSLKVRSRVA